VKRPAPTVGSDNRRVIGDLDGLTDVALAELASAGVIGNELLEDDERRG
jgi:hypothetical protein